LRDEPSGSLDITWGEMVDAQYRATDGVRCSVPAGALPTIHRPEPRLIVQLQESSDLPEELWLVLDLSVGQVKAALAHEFRTAA
jgi:hypothetical protein